MFAGSQCGVPVDPDSRRFGFADPSHRTRRVKAHFEFVHSREDDVGREIKPGLLAKSRGNMGRPCPILSIVRPRQTLEDGLLPRV